MFADLSTKLLVCISWWSKCRNAWAHFSAVWSVDNIKKHSEVIQQDYIPGRLLYVVSKYFMNSGCLCSQCSRNSCKWSMNSVSLSSIIRYHRQEYISSRCSSFFTEAWSLCRHALHSRVSTHTQCLSHIRSDCEHLLVNFYTYPHATNRVNVWHLHTHLHTHWLPLGLMERNKVEYMWFTGHKFNEHIPSSDIRVLTTASGHRSFTAWKSTFITASSSLSAIAHAAGIPAFNVAILIPA